MHWLYDLPLVVLCLGFVLGCAALGVGGVLLAHRFGWTVSPEDNGTAAALHAFVGVVYAVALGLMVVSVQEDYDEVEHAVVTEANAAGDLFRSMGALEPASRLHFRTMLARYVSLVITHEWPATQHGERSDTTWHAMDGLVRGIDAYQPTTPDEERVLAELQSASDELLDARRVRLFLGQQGIGSVTWLVIVVGGIVTLGFACFFYMERPRTQLLLTGLMGGMLGLMLFLVVAMDHPLWGRLSVQPDAFLELRTNFEHLRGEAGGSWLRRPDGRELDHAPGRRCCVERPNRAYATRLGSLAPAARRQRRVRGLGLGQPPFQLGQDGAPSVMRPAKIQKSKPSQPITASAGERRLIRRRVTTIIPATTALTKTR